MNRLKFIEDLVSVISSFSMSILMMAFSKLVNLCLLHGEHMRLQPVQW